MGLTMDDGRACGTLYEKSRIRFDGLDEVKLIELDEDYQVCLRRSEKAVENGL